MIKAPTSAAPDLAPLRRALLSVSDKTGLISFATKLVALGIELVFHDRSMLGFAKGNLQFVFELSANSWSDAGRAFGEGP